MMREAIKRLRGLYERRLLLAFLLNLLFIPLSQAVTYELYNIDATTFGDQNDWSPWVASFTSADTLKAGVRHTSDPFTSTWDDTGVTDLTKVEISSTYLTVTVTNNYNPSVNTLHITNSGTLINPSTITVNTQLDIDSGTTLELQLDNATSYGKISITGSASVGGTIKVTRSISCSEGQEFQLITKANHGISVARLDLPDLNGGLTWDTSQWASDGKIIAVVGQTRRVIIVD